MILFVASASERAQREQEGERGEAGEKRDFRVEVGKLNGRFMLRQGNSYGSIYLSFKHRISCAYECLPPLVFMPSNVLKSPVRS